MKKLMLAMLGLGTLAAAALTNGDAMAESDAYMEVTTTTTSQSACASTNGHTVCATTYYFFGGTLIVPTSDVPSGNFYADVADVYCTNVGWQSSLFQGYSSAGGGVGDQFVACPSGDAFELGLGEVATN
jgi:hypothetical protein